MPKILIADDEITNRIKLEHIVSGFSKCETVDNGVDTYKQAVSGSFDMIILDIEMPGMTGYQVCEKLKQDKRYSHIPIIFISGNADDKDVLHGLELGAVDYITKPYASQIVKARLQTHLELKSSYDNLMSLMSALEKSEHNYRDLFENANDAIFFIDNQLNYIDVNDKAVELFGFTKEEFLNMKITDVIPKYPFTCSDVAFSKINPSEKHKQFEVSSLAKDGRTLDIAVSSSLIIDNDMILGFRDIVRDVTLRNKRMEHIQQLQEDLIENAHLAGMAENSADILHNVGNILVSSNASCHKIMNLVHKSPVATFNKLNQILRENADNLDEFIKKDKRLRPMLEYYLALEEELNDEMTELTDEVRKINLTNDTISEIVMFHQKYFENDSMRNYCRVEELIEDALNILSHSLKKSNIQINKQFTPLPPLLIQKTKFIHILVNIIKNSIEALVDTDLDKRIISINLTVENGNAILAISDSGCGIAPKLIPRILERGFTTKKEGHGFGLHQSSRHIKHMNGQMCVDSNGVGLGCTVSIILPVDYSHS